MVHAKLRGLTLVATLIALVVTMHAADQDASRAAPLAQDGPCDSADPWLATTCYVRGPDGSLPAIVAFHDTPDDSDHRALASGAQVGATWGLAWDAQAGALYAAAFHKRGVAFGPDGPGAIYRIDLASGSVSTWAQVPNAGSDVHDASNLASDRPARAHVGKTSLGDIDLDPSRSSLFAMNLADRHIYRLRLSDGAVEARIAHGASNEAWAADARPFGLAATAEHLYHGLVRSAETSGDAGQLEARVYESAHDGSAMREVLRFGLGYERGIIDRPAGVPARWQPWSQAQPETPGTAPDTAWSLLPQPMLTDIDFDADGDMLLGMRDRYGDMMYYHPSGWNPPPVDEPVTIPAGDLLRATRNGDRWDAVLQPEPFRDAGPGFGAFAAHDETALGGIAALRGTDRVVTSALTPFDILSAGALWFPAGGGAPQAGEEIYALDGEHTFLKANGLGDVERLCAPDAATATPVVETPTSGAATPTTGPPSPAPPDATPAPPTVPPPGSLPTATPSDDDDGPDERDEPGETAAEPEPRPTAEAPEALPKTGGGGCAAGRGNGSHSVIHRPSARCDGKAAGK